MPGLKELSSFRANLKNIADEENVITQWKERYEEYPFPENPPMPDVDVDALLGNVDLPLPDTDSSPDLSFERLPSVADNIVDGRDDVADDTLKDDFEIPSISDSEGMDNFADDFGNNFGNDENNSDTEEFEAPPEIDGIDIDDFNEGLPTLDLPSEPDVLASSNEKKEDEPSRKAKLSKIDMAKWNAEEHPDDELSQSKVQVADDIGSTSSPQNEELPETNPLDDFDFDLAPASQGSEDVPVHDDFDFTLAKEDTQGSGDIPLHDDVDFGLAHEEQESGASSLHDDFDFGLAKEDTQGSEDIPLHDDVDFGLAQEAQESGSSSLHDDFDFTLAPDATSSEDSASSGEEISDSLKSFIPNNDFLPPFDESIKDDSNEIDFSTDTTNPIEEDDGLPEDMSFADDEVIGDETTDDFETQSAKEDDFQLDEDLSNENFPTAQETDDGFTLPDDEITPPMDTIEDASIDDLSTGMGDPAEIDTSLSPDTDSSGINLDDFDFGMQGDDAGADGIDELEGGVGTDDFELPTSQLDVPPLEEAEPLDVLDEVEEIGEAEAVDMPIDSSGIADIGDDIPEIEEVDELDEVEELGDEMEELGDAGSAGDFDFSQIPSAEPEEVDMYTEPVDEDVPPASSQLKTPASMPDNFDTFGGIDVSGASDDVVIDEHASFDLGDNPLEESISDTMGGGFSLPEDYTQFTQEKGSSSSKKTKASDEEDISLTISEDEYQVLLDRISSFPLNVRLEIEDYLAHNDDTTLSKMDLVHFIIGGAKLKKIAAKLSEILDKPIQIPKGFEKRSAEEREAEKLTFKWKLRHRIIPFATIGTVALTLLACISFLTWMFIYLPIVSETIYNKGYALLSENKYDNAMSEFERAGTYKRKKRWYFKYAEGLREKKQFKLAEDVYKWLLFDFNHDKKAGLDYVSMLRDELHNYERAETVLRRQVLDYHVNDETALLSLGDTYLEWASERPDKYEKARQTYSQLINMYGSKDVFLSRMMKYFIRIDKLQEVLPLKEHFVKNLKKLDLSELTELGSYLVAKRYEDYGSTPDHLNESIDDVREILESALKRDEQDANATYNMGRFFLYNRKLDVAKSYFMKSIDKYKKTNNLSSRNLMNNIDAMRLYGEILTEKKEYLQAQEAYSEALGKYQEYFENRLVSPNRMVGKLYQDYGDVNYFISGDLGKALLAYNQALGNMNDTPSLRYRIAYIHYQNKDYEKAMQSLIQAHTEKQKDKNLLYGLGNTMYKRGSYDVAQGYYERLMEILDAERIRKDIILPHAREDHKAFVEEYMKVSNNLGVILNKLALQSGSSEKNGRAMFLFGESSRAWDALTRNQQTMVPSKAVSLAYLNTRNVIKPSTSFEAEIYADIPKTLSGEMVLQNEVDK